jgi:CRP/FNR family cyclic AMP-dependent transcriptional regulator
VATVKLETVLSYVPLFRGLSKRQLKHLASLCEVADYMVDATIVKEGTNGDAFYVVLKGQAVVTMGGRFLTRMVPGDHFGEIAVLDKGPRTASVTSETPMTLAVMSRKSLFKALHDDPEIAFELMSELARMFRRVSHDAQSAPADGKPSPQS